MIPIQVNRLQSLLLLFILAPFIVGISGCETNPATGENEFLLLSTEEQRQLGAEADAQIVAEFGEYNDDAIQSWVERIGKEVQAQSNDTRFTYTFRVLDTEVINAFALPGGYIYVTRGLLAYLQNDAQLAMVLGHEVGHVAANHSAKQYTSSILANVGLAIGGALFEDVRPFLGAAQTGLQLLFLSYSRDNESQSDTLGVKYATLAGYEAAEGAEFFVTLQRLQEQSGTAIPTWTSTHPDPADREENITQKAAEWKAAVGGGLTGVNPEVYLPRINNMVFGQNPRHGFVQNSTFYHPDLQFQFSVPSGWQVGNFATQVQMVSPQEDAVIVFTTASESSATAAADAFRNQQGIQTLERMTVTVGGFPAIRLRTTVTSDDGGTLSVLSYFIEKSPNVYIFHGYTDIGRFNTYANTFEATERSFETLTNASILAVQPYQLDIFEASQTTTFSSLVTPNSGAGMDILSLAILNQKDVSQQVPQGTYLKQVD